jgi:2-dehydropantoate 2-reductase
MRIVIMGTGGVGGYFGGRLAAAGCSVGFVARGPQLQALQTQGLRISSPAGDLHLQQVQASSDPASFGVADVVVFGVKLWDTEAAAQSIRPIVGPHTAVVSFQNGVVKDEILQGVLGRDAVVGGVAYIAASIGEPGHIRHIGAMHKLVFGELDGRRSERLAALSAACTGAGFDHDFSTEIRQRIWEKFVFLVGLSGTTTSMRVPVGQVRAHAASRQFLLDVMDEVVQVARAEGVPLPADFAANRLTFADGLPEAMTSSMHHDLNRGSRLELPWLAGDVVARGLRLGVATPCNRAIAAVLAPHVGGHVG